MTDVYLGIGTNLGDRMQNIRTSLFYVSSLFHIEAYSSIYETEPVGNSDQPEYLNMVIKISANIGPLELLKELKKIENTMGRQISFRNSPRIIDIDILLFDDIQVDLPELKIPHPELSERAFVLIPLAELIPDYKHPVAHKTIRQLKEALSSKYYINKIDMLF